MHVFSTVSLVIQSCKRPLDGKPSPRYFLNIKIWLNSQMVMTQKWICRQKPFHVLSGGILLVSLRPGDIQPGWTLPSSWLFLSPSGQMIPEAIYLLSRFWLMKMWLSVVKPVLCSTFNWCLNGVVFWWIWEVSLHCICDRRVCSWLPPKSAFFCVGPTTSFPNRSNFNHRRGSIGSLITNETNQLLSIFYFLCFLIPKMFSVPDLF